MKNATDDARFPWTERIELRSDAETALFAGDVLHHPVHASHPERLSILDALPEDPLRSRRRALDVEAKRDATLFNAHFADSSAGKVSRRGEAYARRFLRRAALRTSH